MKEYILKFSKLRAGNHEFTYSVKDSFFKNFDESPVESGELNVNVNLEKTASVLTLNFHISGTIDVPCDRCLDLINLDIDSNNTLYVKFGDERTDITDVDQVMMLDNSDTEIDLSRHIFEYICLSIPFRVTHEEFSDSECDADMLKKLNQYLISEETDSEKTDPRWDALKTLRN